MLCSLKNFIHNWLSIKTCFTHLNHCAALLLLLLLLHLLLLVVVGVINGVAIVAVRMCVCKCVCLVYLHAIFYSRTLGTLSICALSSLHPLLFCSTPLSTSFAFLPPICLFAFGLVLRLRLQNCNWCLSALAINCSASSEVALANHALSCEWQVNGEVNKCEYIKCSSRTLPALTGWNSLVLWVL